MVIGFIGAGLFSDRLFFCGYGRKGGGVVQAKCLELMEQQGVATHGDPNF